MITKKNFLRKTMTIKDFLEISCLYLLVVCIIKLITKANIYLINCCVASVAYAILQVSDVILQRKDNENQEIWNQSLLIKKFSIILNIKEKYMEKYLKLQPSKGKYLKISSTSIQSQGMISAAFTHRLSFFSFPPNGKKNSSIPSWFTSSLQYIRHPIFRAFAGFSSVLPASIILHNHVVRGEDGKNGGKRV